MYRGYLVEYRALHCILTGAYITFRALIEHLKSIRLHGIRATASMGIEALLPWILIAFFLVELRVYSVSSRDAI